MEIKTLVYLINYSSAVMQEHVLNIKIARNYHLMTKATKINVLLNVLMKMSQIKNTMSINTIDYLARKN